MTRGMLRVVAALVIGAAACSSGGRDDAGPRATTTATATDRPVADPLPIELRPLPGRPSAVAVHQGVVWVADDARDVVLRLDASDGTELGPPVTVPTGPVALAAGPDAIWVAGATGTLTAIDVSTAEAGAPVTVGGTSSDVELVGGTVWVADLGDSRLVPVDAATGDIGAPIEVPAGVVRLAASGDSLWVTNLENTVTRVDLADRTVAGPVPVGSGPIGLSIADGTVWVADGDDGTVTRLDEATGEPAGEPVRVGPAPVALVVVGDDLWVIEQDGRSVSRIDARSGEVERRSEDLATRPRGIAAGGGAVWVVGVDPGAAVLVLTDG